MMARTPGSAIDWIAKRRELLDSATVGSSVSAQFVTDALISLPLALNALEAALGMADVGAITSRARGDSEEERRWLDFRIAVESTLMPDNEKLGVEER